MIHQEYLHNKQHKVPLLWRICLSVVWERPFEHLLNTVGNGSMTGKYLHKDLGCMGTF